MFSTDALAMVIVVLLVALVASLLVLAIVVVWRLIFKLWNKPLAPVAWNPQNIPAPQYQYQEERMGQ
jgi:hypothetical protein